MSMELGPYTNFHELNQDWFLNEFNKVLKEWAEMKKNFNNLNDAFNDLKTYVHDYFKNLDVQEEINNKLDEMVNNGTFPRLLKSMLNYVCAEWYGAKGDGISDDTNALNLALNTGLSIKLQNGKKYKITSPLNIKSNQLIDGNGATILLDIGDGNNYAINARNIDNFSIINTSFTSEKKKGDNVFLIYIYMENCSNIKIESSYFENSSAAIGLYKSHEIIINNNIIKNSFQFPLTREEFAGVYGYGINLNTCWNAFIENNVLGTEDSPIERHSIYVSKLITDEYYDYYNSNINIIGNIITQIRYSENILPLTGAEFCIKVISGKSVNISENMINNGRGAILLTTLFKGCGDIKINNNKCNTYSYFIRCVNEKAFSYDSVTVKDNIVSFYGTYPCFITYTNVNSLVSTNNIIKNESDTLFYCYFEGEGKDANYIQNNKTFIDNDIITNFNGLIRFNYIKSLYYNAFSNITDIIKDIFDGERVDEIDITVNNTPKLDFKKTTFSKTSFKYFDTDFNSYVIYDPVGKTLVDNEGNLIGANTRPAVYPINKKFYDFTIGLIIYNTEIGYSKDSRQYGYFATTEELKKIVPTDYGYPIYNTTNKKPYWFDAYNKIWKDSEGVALE